MCVKRLWAGIPRRFPLGQLTFVAPRCFSETSEEPLRRIERLFLPCELWKSKGTLSSSRSLDCPPISRRSKGSSPSGRCWLPWKRKGWSKSHNETTPKAAFAKTRRLRHRRKGCYSVRTGAHQRTLLSAVESTTKTSEEPRKIHRRANKTLCELQRGAPCCARKSLKAAWQGRNILNGACILSAQRQYVRLYSHSVTYRIRR